MAVDLQMDTENDLDFANVGIVYEAREKIIHILNTLLADEQVLYAKTRNYHWNVVGPHFMALHDLFEEHYEQLADTADEVAERVRMLSGDAIGTLTEFLTYTRLAEAPGEKLDAQTMVAELLDDHETIINFLRQDIETCSAEYGDEGTVDLLIQTLRMHEKMAWMLRATLKDDHHDADNDGGI